MRMRTRFLALALAAVTAVTTTGITAFAADAVVHEGFVKYTLGSNRTEYDYLFAAGKPVVVTARADGQEGATIHWNGETKDVGPYTRIFGGYHDKDTVVPVSDITMEGGTVVGIYGGGLHESRVTTANVTIKGGTVTEINGGGASSSSITLDICGCDHSKSSQWFDKTDPEEIKADAYCRVDHVNLKVEGGTIKGVIFGGGEGISYTGAVNLSIKDGDLSNAYVIAGGSNGYTGEANVAVTGGAIKVLQGVNRGSMDTIDFRVTGGEIKKMYLGGETGDSGVTGTFNHASATVSGGTVENLQPGTSNGTEVTAADNKLQVAANKDCVENFGTLADKFGAENVREVRYSAGGGSGDALEIAKDEFWADVKAKIRAAEVGSTVEIDMKHYTEFPWTVMRTLNEHPVTLVVKRTEGKTLTIPAGEAQSTDNNIIYFMMDRLEKLYAQAD